MRYYHIYPTSPCLLSVGGMPCGMDFINIESDDADSFPVSVTPMNGLPFAFMVDKQLKLPPSVRVIKLPKNHFDLLVSPSLPCTITRASVLFNGMRLCPTIVNGTELEIWIDDIKLCPPSGFPTFDTVSINNHAVLEVAMPNYLALIDSNMQLIGEVHGNKITRKNNTIQSITYLNDIAQRGEVCIYKIENTLNLVEKYNIYTQGSPIRPTDTQQYPTAFLQAVLSKDYDEARFYLSSELNETLSNEDLAEFFPYSELYPCNYYPDNCVVLVQNNVGYLMRITCSNVIENIEEA